MNFLVQFGVGLIFNAISSAQAAGQQREMQEQMDEANAQSQAEMQEMNETLASQMYPGGDPFAPPGAEQPQLALMNQAPPFPEQAAQNLQQMQAQHSEQMQSLSDQFLQNATALKQQFLEENHLATQEPDPQQPDAPPQLTLDDDGKPQVVPGKEQPPQKEAREAYEDDKKTTLTAKHSDQTQQFMADEKSNIQQFVAQNKPDLANPAVQQQLHNMLMESQKRALNLTTEQEREMLKHDAYTPEMETNVDNYIDNKSRLRDEQARKEEDSEDAAALYQHQQDLAMVLQQKKDELNESAMQSSFLKGPPRFGGNGNGSAPVDVANVLPPYLSQALYGMGIYQV